MTPTDGSDTASPRGEDTARLLTALGMHPRVPRAQVGAWGRYLDRLAAAGLSEAAIDVEHEAVGGGITLTAWGPREAVERALELDADDGALLELSAMAMATDTARLDGLAAWRRQDAGGVSEGWCAHGVLALPLVERLWPGPAPLDREELRELRHAVRGAAAGVTETAWALGRLPPRTAWTERLGEVEPETEGIVAELLDLSSEVLALEHRQASGAITASGVRLAPTDATRAQLLALLFTEQPDTRDVELAAVQGALDVEGPSSIDLLATDDGPRVFLHLGG